MVRRKHWRRGSNVFWVRTPFSIDNFDCDQAGQTLLLATAIESGKFAAYGNNGRRDWILGKSPWDNTGLHGLDIVIVPAAVGLLGLRIVGRGVATTCGAAVIANVLSLVDGVFLRLIATARLILWDERPRILVDWGL